MNRDAVLM